MITAAITGYGIGVFIHVLAVVVAFGATFAFPVFVAAAERSAPQSLPTVLRGVITVDRMLVTPGMVVLLLAGLYLVADADISMGEPFISVGFLAIILLFGLSHGYLLPRTRQALALAERDLADGGELSAEYEAVSRQIERVGKIVTLIVVIAIFFMVVKP
jgi:uncharacterized membrane protein